MKTPLFTRSIAFGALAILGSISFSCNDSGSAGYDGNFNPNASTSGAPATNLGAGTNNALTGLGLGQTTLDQVSTATKLGESDTKVPGLNDSQFAATASGGPLSNSPLSGSNGSGNQSAGSSGSGLSNLAANKTASGGSATSGGGGGAYGGGVASLGDTHTSAMTDPSKSGPNGDGTMMAADALGKSNSSDSQSGYAAGGGGQGSGKGVNPFASLFGGDGNGAAGGAGNTTTEFRRDPSSLAGQADGKRNGMDPMGSQDPANYFTLLNTGDNLFKIVERRYVSKSKQWAISDAQDVRRSINR